ncbi:acyl-CoA thioesterase [Confluentibacter flavum]|uniref:Thioesterase n=1 Tax=Confluentibacter flavum TaxID=1909700 RepID=A0A2N3HHY1_9FLAO|nr:acyl-ACP thioesterase domain-containing protein [Confluentibacter flavum]PKQ44590.1 thioesterase [Confluentibacter flavum]
MSVFESVITVKKSHLDDILHVNNVHYVQWVQDVAKLHWESNATEAILKRYFWVLITHFIEYKNSAFLGDTINVKTYVAKYKGAVCHRVVEITNKTTNTLLATSETKWCLIDAETKRPTRITKEISELFE